MYLALDMNAFNIEEHKINSPAVVHVLKQIDKHAVETNERLSSLETTLESVSKAFPNNDLEGHKRYHAMMIEVLAEKRRLRQAIQEKTISGLVWACMVGLGLAVWHEFVNLIHGAK